MSRLQINLTPEQAHALLEISMQLTQQVAKGIIVRTALPPLTDVPRPSNPSGLVDFASQPQPVVVPRNKIKHKSPKPAPNADAINKLLTKP